MKFALSALMQRLFTTQNNQHIKQHSPTISNTQQ